MRALGIVLLQAALQLQDTDVGAAGSNETIYALLMLLNDFVVASANIEQIDEAAKNLPIVRENVKKRLNAIMNNSFGFGGTNASLIFTRV